jgi:uncharacterized protein YwqG
MRTSATSAPEDFLFMSRPNNDFSIEYSGLEGIWKSTALWGVVGVVCSLLSPLPARLVLMPLLLGLATGLLSAWWIYLAKTSRIELTRWFALLSLLVYTLTQENVESALGYLAMGSFLSASINASMAFFVPIALNRLQERIFGPGNGRKISATPQDPQKNREAFLKLLPVTLRNEIAASFVPITAIEPGTPSETEKPEASSFGGTPLLAPELSWPIREGRPLDFLGQINLEEAQDFLPEDAPRRGLLSFFYDSENQPWGGEIEDLGAARILYSSDPTLCVPWDTPGGTPARPRQALKFSRTISQVMDEALEERFFSHCRSMKGRNKDRLDDLHEQIIEQSAFDNRLFSAPGLVQNAMDSELRTASTTYGLDPSTAWTMVLQVGSVDEQGWCWGDAGCLYFWVPTIDLVKNDFDRVWVVLQCT